MYKYENIMHVITGKVYRILIKKHIVAIHHPVDNWSRTLCSCR